MLPIRWTLHAQAKMGYYKLSRQRVRSVISSPKRLEIGVAPKTVAAMQPTSLKNAPGRAGARKEEKWNQEIWVMFQDAGKERKIISAWRYPGMTKPRDLAQRDFMKQEYNEYTKTS